ncbi:MAG: hypothetical protein EON91_00460 [Brevundimonas sp.]|uniref:zeta toxin family protein n=1 Tax=Brevundimonas sp. TaxID=1871086 RepID=UPI0011FEC71C|nr:zeta toxin family protein [Brevundimonas sp.]RZJ19549.1 MAG: hypothetical protein EON91_00460 [Brevundimonas sp.]
MPTLVLLAGPNGAGKTTFINGFLRERAEAFQFVNPDEVARHLPPGPGRDLAAGRLVLERLEALTAARADVVLETTLATRTHARRIRDWKAAGYRIELVYLRLPPLSSSSGKPRSGADRGTQRRAGARTCQRRGCVRGSPSAPLGPPISPRFRGGRRRMTKEGKLLDWGPR